MPGCLLKIKEILPHLNESEKKVAQYVFDHPEEAKGMLIGELAERSDTSKAAVIRMCKSLGYGGYRDFRIGLASDIASQLQVEHKYTDIQPGDSLDIIAQNVCFNNQKSIEDTRMILDPKQVEAAVLALRHASNIAFYGVGASGIVAMDAQQKFLRINRSVITFLDFHLQAIATSNLTKGDVVVVISYSGETRETLDIVNIAKKREATVIGITKYGKSTLSELSDIRLFHSSPETTMRSGAMGSRIAQLSIIDIIFTGYASLDYSRIEGYLDQTQEVIKSRKNHKKHHDGKS
ncbi:MurR/RpiR family transcriptional regulator [Peribacillus muralis]|uniref:MurR/RpiR family transcriptional regulator n=1 Tax=Peribacillus muralis TaxID=264697 RepID=UPI001F4DDDCE|nr:MurR/RpiR family transcriptional regulator [Peribacillus muralis]MCK1992223.1 MurR/RpiR family transcriptional regulator [Peribacillus muralis]MCK2012779.1 MurR/RpiR family transcriptional regulator [Peribacillus muralis]